MPERQSEIMMPVTEDHALRQFEIEALRQITDNLRRLNDKMDKQGESINLLDVRMARMEATGMDKDVQEMTAMLLRVKDRLALLEADKHRREGAVSAFEWVLKNWPGLFGFLGLVVLILSLTGKLKGLG